MGLRQDKHMTTCKVAIVGAGYMAQEHAKAFASIPGVSIVGVCGRSPERAQRLAEAYLTRTFPSIAEMYAQTRADLVVVTVTELFMRDVAMACFAHPWTCLLEKPVGVDLAEAEQILAASRAAAGLVYVALNRRSYGSTRSALEKLAHDASPRLIDVLDQQDMDGARALGQPERVVQNYMYANSIHLVDYVLLLGRGAVARIDTIHPWDASAPGTVAAAVHFEGGDTAVYQAIWDGPGPWAVSVTTRTMRLEMRPLERLGIQRRGERRLTEVPADPIDTDFKPGLRIQAEQAVAGCRGEAPLLATLESATRSMRLCASLYGMPGAPKHVHGI
jgi:predicted dehydrogenase